MSRFERQDSAGYMTNWAARLFARAIHRKLRHVGLSSGHLPVYFALGDGGELTQKALTAIAAVEQPTMAITLARMERDGLVQRRPDPSDKRSSLVSLTPSGLEKVPAVREAVASVNAAAVSKLNREQQESYLAALRIIIGALEAITGEN